MYGYVGYTYPVRRGNRHCRQHRVSRRHCHRLYTRRRRRRRRRRVLPRAHCGYGDRRVGRRSPRCRHRPRRLQCDDAGGGHSPRGGRRGGRRRGHRRGDGRGGGRGGGRSESPRGHRGGQRGHRGEFHSDDRRGSRGDSRRPHRVRTRRHSDVPPRRHRAHLRGEDTPRETL